MGTEPFACCANGYGLVAKISGEGPRRGQRARIHKPASASQPLISSKLIGVAAIRVHQHVDGKDQPVHRPGAVRIHQELGNRDRSAGSQRLESLLEQRLAALLTFAVQNVPQRGHVMTGAKVGLLQIAFAER